MAASPVQTGGFPMVTKLVAYFQAASENGVVPARVRLGCRVRVGFEDGEEMTLSLGPVANPSEGVISQTSPLGQALRDASAGDVVRYLTPMGAEVVRVLAVFPPA